MIHGLDIDWPNEELECKCGYKPKEGPSELGFSDVPDFEEHLRNAWREPVLEELRTLVPRLAMHDSPDDWQRFEELVGGEP